ncbi:S26 family signal peptidase [Microbacterium sp. Bi121]|uniref:S26 family signal peptidase n=1 Tax=Microbacterium sp. Bi121 TaxID=2822348 RepID=UPI001DE65269|nr:S26 family signal peptidase [Microbacterium sp. Bi121]CAH0152501.1 Signal peptidase I W [Microbacterium sp. Bi121]
MGVALGHGVGAGVLGMLALTAVLVAGVPLATGASAFTIMDRSMEPALPPGTLIVTRPVDAPRLDVGDVIAFTIDSSEPTVMTRRVVDLDRTVGGSVLTRGDATVTSVIVAPEQILGRLWYSVPLLGWVNIAVTGPLRAALVPAVAAAICAYIAWTVIARARRRRRAR